MNLVFSSTGPRVRGWGDCGAGMPLEEKKGHSDVCRRDRCHGRLQGVWLSKAAATNSNWGGELGWQTCWILPAETRDYFGFPPRLKKRYE